ncbi:hypothetical protein H0H81_004859 [Sphagnurus paluster]|uniref:Uncharacterized protein n=1 Tax=Sphagnurus paluster TaxID=117069 RepID=A0A9P7GHC1_9AGAR|nr:hypothetical protein H0H81_004859 [Sphagnurus paluster]
MTDANNQINNVLSKLTALGTVLIPMNLVTGIWGMNVHVPGEGIPLARRVFLSSSKTTSIEHPLFVKMRFFKLISSTLFSSTLAFSLTPLPSPTPTHLRPPLPNDTIGLPAVRPGAARPNRSLRIFATAVLHSFYETHIAQDELVHKISLKLADNGAIRDNVSRIRAATVSAINEVKREVKDFFGYLGVEIVLNVLLRAGVRALSPGQLLLDSGSLDRLVNDVLAAHWSRQFTFTEESKQLTLGPAPSPFLDTTTSVMILGLDMEVQIVVLNRKYLKYILMHADASAVISFGIHAALYSLGAEQLIDTNFVMEIIDYGLGLLIRGNKPFYTIGEASITFDTLFANRREPGHETLYDSIDVPLVTSPVDYTQPGWEEAIPLDDSLPNIQKHVHDALYDPIKVQIGALPVDDARPERDEEAIPPPRTALTKRHLVCEEPSSRSSLPNIFYTIITVCASFVVAMLIKHIYAIVVESYRRQKLINLYLGEGFRYLPALRRWALLTELRSLQLVPLDNALIRFQYISPIPSELDEEEIEARIIELFCLLGSSRRRRMLA